MGLPSVQQTSPHGEPFGEPNFQLLLSQSMMIVCDDHYIGSFLGRRVLYGVDRLPSITS